MRNLYDLDFYRVTEGHLIKLAGGYTGDHSMGMFRMRSPEDGGVLRIIAAAAEGWDHVSVSRADRCPTWGEMDYIKRRFFLDDETAFQLHVPIKSHINIHSHCLHLWRAHDSNPPMPPSIMV
jgi:hypothetical protein